MTKLDTLHRQWTMLRLIPSYPGKVDTGTLCRKLEDEGFPVSVRTIQRDLRKLSKVFPLWEDDRSIPRGWSWGKDAKVLDIPGMEPPTALTFHIAEKFLSNQLPVVTLGYLKPHFRRAEEVLNATTANGYHTWADKIRVLPRGQPLLPARVKENVQTIVYKALFEERRLIVHYLPRSQEENEYEVNPLGLVFRQGVTYLLATLWDYDEAIQLALHRIQAATLMDKAVTIPEGFDIDAYIDQGEFEYPVSSRPMRLRLLFEKDAAFHLGETPLSQDQVIKTRPDGKVEVRATVKNTRELRWWLLGFGSNVEILGPVSLRKEFKETAREIYHQYFPEYLSDD